MLNTKTPMVKVDNRIHSNSPTIQINMIPLNEDNFLCWSQSVRLHIRGQGKIGYITIEFPKLDDPLFAPMLKTPWLKTSAAISCATLRLKNCGIV